MRRDVFLCHASADKDAIARPLYETLRGESLSVWFDEAEIAWGDPIALAIQRGLTSSRYVVVLLTPEFVAPRGHWRHEELRYLPILPAIGFFLVDPRLRSGIAKVERSSYTSQSLSCPLIPGLT